MVKRRISMKFDVYARIGLIVGAAWCVLAFLFTYSAFSSGRNPFGELLLIQWAAFSMYMLLAGAFFRLVYSHYRFPFKSAFRYALIVGMVGNLLFLGLGYLFLVMNWEVVREIYIDNMITYMQTTWESGRMQDFGEVNEEGFKQKMEEIKQVTPFRIVFYDFSIKTFITLIISLIIAVVLRKSNPL